MWILKALSAVLAGVVVYVFFRTLYVGLTAWWRRRISTYAAWMATEFEFMLRDMSVVRARRIITGLILGPMVLGYLLGGVVPAAAFGLAGYFGGWGLVALTRHRRLKTIDNQLADALLMMANGMKSGLSLQQAIELAALEMKAPIADEFGRVLKEIHLGRLTDEALRKLAERVPLPDVQLAVNSILILRETGGNMSETFQVIAQTVVERKKVQGKIEAMTAQGMTQGIVMCLFPIILLLLFSIIAPDYIRPFFTTPLGWLMMLVVFVLDGTGLGLMLKLVRVDV